MQSLNWIHTVVEVRAEKDDSQNLLFNFLRWKTLSQPFCSAILCTRQEKREKFLTPLHVAASLTSQPAPFLLSFHLPSHVFHPIFNSPHGQVPAALEKGQTKQEAMVK